MTKWMGEGALWVLFPALWVGTPTREPENSHWPERVEQAPGGSVVGTLVKYPGWGGAGAQKAATKATGWLLHRQQRWTKRAEGRGAGLPWQECLLPGGWGAPTSAKDKIRAAWTTPLTTLQSEQSRRIGSLLHPPLCSSPQWGQPTEPSREQGFVPGGLGEVEPWPRPSPAVGQAGLHRPSSLLLPVPWGCVGWRPRECQAAERAESGSDVLSQHDSPGTAMLWGALGLFLKLPASF